jgi:hypothetical protein
MTSRRSKLLWQFTRNFLTLAGAIAFYYLVPLSSDERPIWRLVLFIACLSLLIWLIVQQLMKQVAAGPDPGVRVRSLITLLYPVVVLFALIYYVMQDSDPTQFESLQTRTDALYYTVITLGTVGYGDVHAVGQAARIVTTIQVAFDLVVIGALIAVASSRFQIVPTKANRKGTDNSSADAAGSSESAG